MRGLHAWLHLQQQILIDSPVQRKIRRSLIGRRTVRSRASMLDGLRLCHVNEVDKPGGTGTAEDFLPARQSLPALRQAVQRCQGCGLYADATQAVFGAGSAGAEIMLVGEQPGDKEDVAGEPFVGPAGQLLDRALESAGIDRSLAYVTNMVKHFKWKRSAHASAAPPRRRLHDKPNAYEVGACRPWLEAEIRQVQSRIVVCLGSTAAQALLGQTFRVRRQRGEFFASELAPLITATVHPSSILRAADAAAREREMAEFIRDLRRVADKLTELGGRPKEQVAG